jgi:hypothetical protein
MKLALQAKLLHDLEQTRQAGELLDQAVQALDDDHQSATLDPAEKTFFLEQLALSYVYIDDQAKAAELKNRLEQQAAYASQLSQAMVLNHIRQQRFEEAIAGLELRNLALETLSQSAPEKAQGLRQKLIDSLAAESAWGYPNAA